MGQNVKLILGDCIEKMKEMEENSIDTIITDPPYGLNFLYKDWDKFKEDKNPGGGNTGRDTPYARNRVAPSFYQYGDKERATFQSFSYAWAKEALRVAKPGSILLAMGSPRTYHRLACAIEDAGWEIRDMMAWVHAQGFPKARNISKAIDKKFGLKRKVVGETNSNIYENNKNHKFYTEEEGNPAYRKGEITAPTSPEAQLWDGWRTALKPALEPIVLAMKPRDGTFVENALKWGVGGLWIEGGRIGNDTVTTFGRPKGGRLKLNLNDKDYYDKHKGRYPTNFIHDGSQEVMDCFPAKSGKYHKSKANKFFYCPKVSKSERNAGLMELDEKKDGDMLAKFYPDWERKGIHVVTNNHPTLKPIRLMQYLARLTMIPTGGVVLDPFMGAGTTGIACVIEGRDFIGIEKYDPYLQIATKRIAYFSEEERKELWID